MLQFSHCLGKTHLGMHIFVYLVLSFHALVRLPVIVRPPELLVFILPISS